MSTTPQHRDRLVSAPSFSRSIEPGARERQPATTTTNTLTTTPSPSSSSSTSPPLSSPPPQLSSSASTVSTSSRTDAAASRTRTRTTAPLLRPLSGFYSPSQPTPTKTHAASRAANLVSKNSLACLKPRLPASTNPALADGRSRHSITPSSTIRSSRRPVTATTTPSTVISNLSSAPTRTTLSGALSATTTPRLARPSTRPPSSLSSVSSTTNVSAISSSLSSARNATVSSSQKRNASTAASTTNTATKNTVAAAAAAAFLRAPLSRKDHNAHTGGMTRQQKTFTAKMAPDKGTGPHPRQPHLAASAIKGINRAPLTPKIAASTHTTTATTPTPAPRIAQAAGATTPLARRTQPPPNHQTVSTPSLRDEYASPISSFLSNNITPRSGSRQSRVDSSHNSPSGTPSQERDAWDLRSGLGISGNDSDAGPRRPLAFTPVAADLTAQHHHHPQHPHGNQSNADAAPAAADSKFFYASDAKGAQQPKPPVQPARQGGPTFFYANGLHENRANAPSPIPALGHTPENRASKFIYANGVPDIGPSHGQTTSSRTPSVVSTASRMTTARLNHAAMQHQPSVQAQPPRPVSPIKMAALPSITTLRGSTQSSLPAPNRTSVVGQASISPTVSATKRRVSFENGPPHHKGHSRTGSLVNANLNTPIATTTPTVANSLTVSDSSPSSKALSSPVSDVSTSASMGSPTMPVPQPLQLQLQTVEERMGLDSEPKHHEAVYSELHSPTKATHSADHLTELIANARRERKVQDLEITNASLAAINRSLERRLRKQTAEIRRYRRLSRAGRLSIASVASTAASEGAVSEAGVSALSLSDLSEEEPEEETEEESDFSDTDSGSESLSPEARAARDERHRQRDERRLQLDLTKHRELLVDSQKINQSLRKCLNWTEELIQEGRKALAYQVRVSDIKLGGRILVTEDEEEDAAAEEADAAGDDDVGDDLDDVTLDPDAEDTIHGARNGEESSDEALSTANDADDNAGRPYPRLASTETTL